MSAAAVLRRLHDAGVEVRFEAAPDQIRLSGPLTGELVELARTVKPDLLALIRPRVQVHPCACCGRFFLSEPAAVCFWCRTPKHGDKRDKSPPTLPEDTTSVPSVPAFRGAREIRACPSCGGGLDPTDPEGEVCYTCRRVAGREER